MESIPTVDNHMVNVKQCSRCKGDAIYFCNFCQLQLCLHCRDVHIIDLDSEHHNVTIYRERYNFLPKQKVCVKHQSHIYEMYCTHCAVPICFHCRQHKTHQKLDIRTSYELKRNQNKESIIYIRSGLLNNKRVLLEGVKQDFEKCKKELNRHRSMIETKAQRLKNLMDVVFIEFCFQSKCLLIELNKNMTRIQNYEQRYEQFANRPVKFLRFIKTTCFSQIEDTPSFKQHTLLSLAQEIKLNHLIELLSEINIIERGERQTRVQSLLKLMPYHQLKQSFTVPGAEEYFHISCVTRDRVWVTFRNNILLTDTETGDPLFRVTDSCDLYYVGLHTVNSQCELIYIDAENNIKKLSNDMKTNTLFLKVRDSIWKPWCVYVSPLSSDLLVGMWRRDRETFSGNVARYNNSGDLTQTIQHDQSGQKLYRFPRYITENTNMDIVVSDYDSCCGAVVVTDYEGRHRFSYKGPPSGPGLEPLGICTDALSHILVCDKKSGSVQMIDKDGRFLSYLLPPQSPLSLGYDATTHLLWVGSWENRVYVYRYIKRNHAYGGIKKE